MGVWAHTGLRLDEEGTATGTGTKRGDRDGGLRIGVSSGPAAASHDEFAHQHGFDGWWREQLPLPLILTAL
jgi:hypothetical protein